LLQQIITLIFLIAINAFFAATEISIISLKELNVEKKAGEGDKKAKQILSIIKEPSKFLATIQVGITFTSFFTSAEAAVGLSDKFGNFLKSTHLAIISSYSSKIAFVAITIIISLISLIFGELIPKRIALAKSELIANKAIGVIRIVNIIGKPMVEFLTIITNFILKLILGNDTKKEEEITEEEIRMMINVGEEKGIFHEMETKMINSIFEFDDITAADIMTPRPDIVALNINSTFEEAIKIITEEKYSRIPVYNENIDNVVGILYTKDIIDYMAFKTQEVTFDIRNFTREPFFVTEYIKIDSLLKEMQKKNVHICVVIDEYGTTAGIATIEDMLEQIVGNIFDEFDDREEEVNIKGDHEFEIDGGINMSELNELLESDYEENYDTVSGLILDTLGRFPKEDEEIEIDGYNFKILSVEKKRIKKLLIKKM
jgi:putative hemolysin